jgi:hypothetical protein
MKAFWVSHTHWDREWYRTFQAFRARLVDTIDGVLERIARDPGFRFLLDGQTVVLEDYLEIRPARAAELEAACRDRRLSIGPWYVQPDSLLPAGEAHVRNLLAGRRVAERVGRASTVAYTPDSFGHPAQFPQLLSGFGLDAFVYWRGNGAEIDGLPSEYRWVAPDGSTTTACVLLRGYFGAALLPADRPRAVAQLAELGRELAAHTRQDAIVFMNGIDHARADDTTDELTRLLAHETGWDVRRALLDDFVAVVAARGEPLPEYRGELVGARLANLLPGVWSARMPLKLENRRCESALVIGAEPWSAIAGLLGLPDERPSLRVAWRAVLLNQAHDSIGGCSIDAVHRQMAARYDECRELAEETGRRCLERMAGLPVERETPAGDELCIAVFNPSPHPRTDVVRIALDAAPAMAPGPGGIRLHPVLAANRDGVGFEVDGVPARLVPGCADGRFFFDAASVPLDVELIARDVPAFGWKRLRLAPAPPSADAVDDGREIEAGALRVRVDGRGTLSVEMHGRRYDGLLEIEDRGDRGDSYDADLLDDGERAVLERVTVRRRRHAGGIRCLEVARRLAVPARLDPSRERRVAETAPVHLRVEARVAEGVSRIDLRVRIENHAEDHRLRLLFPTGSETAEFRAATTFDTVVRSTARVDASGWVHGAPATFPHQGAVSLNGLTVVAPGLPEAEVGPDGTLAITLLRAVGWLSRADLRSRPGLAGPLIPAPGAQCLAPFDARISLLPVADAGAVRDAESDLRGVFAPAAGHVLAPAIPVIEIEPADVFTALKPAEDGDGAILRLLNATDAARRVRIRVGIPIVGARLVRLDEHPIAGPVEHDGDEVRIEVPPRALRSIRLSAARRQGG